MSLIIVGDGGFARGTSSSERPALAGTFSGQADPKPTRVQPTFLPGMITPTRTRKKAGSNKIWKEWDAKTRGKPNWSKQKAHI